MIIICETDVMKFSGSSVWRTVQESLVCGFCFRCDLMSINLDVIIIFEMDVMKFFWWLCVTNRARILSVRILF